MRLLSEADVLALIGPDMAMEAAATAFRRQTGVASAVPGRLDVTDDAIRLRALVLAGSDRERLSLKLNMHVQGSARDPQRRSASLLMLWDMAMCRPRAMIAAAAFNDHRTASGFGVAARVLARRDAATLAVFGAGKLAAPTISYLTQVRPIERVIVVSRSRNSALGLVERLRGTRHPRRIAFEACDDPQSAAQRADIVATVTTSADPVFPGAAVRDGTLVILGGANRPDRREADDDLIRRAHIHTDDTEICIAKAGDLALPLAAGALRREQIAGEIGAVIDETLDVPRGIVPVFKSTGLPLQDIVLGEMLVRAAESRGIGMEFDPLGTAGELVAAD